MSGKLRRRAVGRSSTTMHDGPFINMELDLRFVPSYYLYAVTITCYAKMLFVNLTLYPLQGAWTFRY